MIENILFWYVTFGFVFMTGIMFLATRNVTDKTDPHSINVLDVQKAINALNAISMFALMLLLVFIWPYVLVAGLRRVGKNKA